MEFHRKPFEEQTYSLCYTKVNLTNLYLLWIFVCFKNCTLSWFTGVPNFNMKSFHKKPNNNGYHQWNLHVTRMRYIIIFLVFGWCLYYFQSKSIIKFYIFISVKKDHINIFLLSITTFMYSFQSQYEINFLIIGFICGSLVVTIKIAGTIV